MGELCTGEAGEGEGWPLHLQTWLTLDWKCLQSIAWVPHHYQLLSLALFPGQSSTATMSRAQACCWVL